jgi:predicted aspartyl protease
VRRRGLLGFAAAGLIGAVRADAPTATLALTDTDGFLSVIAGINGTAMRLLVDTGAETGLLTLEAARLVRARRVPGARMRMQGTGGDGALVPQAALDEVALGPLRIADVHVPVAPLPEFPRLSPPVAGLLGGDLLSHFVVTIDVARQALVLGSIAAARDRIPAERHSNRLTIPVTLDGQSLRALVDTGARSILLAARAAPRLGVTQAMLAADPGGITSGVDLRQQQFHWHRFGRLQVGAEVLRDVMLTVAPLEETAELLLGVPFFDARRVELDFRGSAVGVGR